MVGSVHGEYRRYGERSPVLRKCPGLSLLSPRLLLLWSDGQGRFPFLSYITCDWSIGFTYLLFLVMIRKDKSLYLHTFRQPRYVTTLVIVQPVITWGDSMRTRTRLRRRFTSLPGPRLTLMPSDSVKWVHSSGSIHSIYLIFINVYIIFFIEKKYITMCIDPEI